MTPVSWYHDGSGPSLTCGLCCPETRPMRPTMNALCPRCSLRWEAHEWLPCQGERTTP
ncbi:MAG: hypothetical protein HW395_38 [candidate division NC10 bacterium]|nr:hypothetical protein [candidate division NC10 bacterium]